MDVFLFPGSKRQKRFVLLREFYYNLEFCFKVHKSVFFCFWWQFFVVYTEWNPNMTEILYIAGEFLYLFLLGTANQDIWGFLLPGTFGAF